MVKNYDFFVTRVVNLRKTLTFALFKNEYKPFKILTYNVLDTRIGF